MSDQKRIENLEWAVRRLSADVAALRASVEALGGQAPAVGVPAVEAVPPSARGDDARAEPAGAALDAASPPPRPPDERWTGTGPTVPSASPPSSAAAPAAAPAPGRVRDVRIETAGVDLESLVGRYGAMVLAALTILLGVGAFIGWAVEHVQLGPGARVALGAVGAAGVAVLGEVLRRRGARSYGNSMLALALALVHLVAWGAGPSLAVIPVGAALAIAIAASLALAVLAVREGEELLFVVGLIGSLVAPFAFAGPEGNLLVLLAYGLGVRAVGMHVIRERSWRWAERTLAAGASGYAFATLAGAGGAPDERTFDRVAPALFTLACMASAVVQGGRGGRNIALADAVTLVVTIGVLDQISEIGLMAAALGITGVAIGYLALARADGGERTRAWAWTLAVPAALLFVALSALEQVEGPTGALVALSWCVLATIASVADVGRGRGVHALFAGMASTLAIGLFLSERQLVLPAAFAIHAVVLAAIAWRARLRELFGSAWLALALGWMLAHGELMQRRPWQYTPFLTRESLVMVAVLVAAAAVSWATLRLARDEGAAEQAAAALGAAPLVAFFWVRTELARAWAPETATFLLIAYYAASGTAALLAGRRLRRTVLRRTGLALAIYAALKALVEASGLSAVSLRIGSYLLVGCFLLAVAYWYRAGRGGGAADARDEAAGKAVA